MQTIEQHNTYYINDKTHMTLKQWRANVSNMQSRKYFAKYHPYNFHENNVMEDSCIYIWTANDKISKISQLKPWLLLGIAVTLWNMTIIVWKCNFKIQTISHNTLFNRNHNGNILKKYTNVGCTKYVNMSNSIAKWYAYVIFPDWFGEIDWNIMRLYRT